MGCVHAALSKATKACHDLVDHIFPGSHEQCTQPDAVADERLCNSDQPAPVLADSAPSDVPVEHKDSAEPSQVKRVSWADQLGKQPNWRTKARAKSAMASDSKRRATQQLSSVKQKQLRARLSSSGTKWDNQDRMLNKAEFSKLQRMIGLRFTLDACCNPDGSNALVPDLYKSAEDSFLEYDCSGHNVWLNPPYADIAPFVKHYVQCKAKAPHNTSAVIVLPKWKGSHTQYLQGMHLIKEYPKGSRIFSAPGLHGSAEREPLGPTPWPVQVYYDPPVAVPLACLADLPVLEEEAAEQQDHSQSELDCVLLEARVAGANAMCLVDSGASHSLLSSRYCQANGIVVSTAPQTVELADGKSIRVLGVCNARIQIGPYKTVHKCWVTALHPAYDLILGRTWLKLSKAIIEEEEEEWRLTSWLTRSSLVLEISDGDAIRGNCKAHNFPCPDLLYPIQGAVAPVREAATCTQTHFGSERPQGSNLRPPGYQACALPLS